MSEDLWLAEHERIEEEYSMGIIDREEAAARLRGLGFNDDEIHDQLAALEEGE